MKSEIEKTAKAFIENERQFHLGFLPTEQSNPKTKDLEKQFKASTAEGVKLLLSVDRDIVPMARRVLGSKPFQLLEQALIHSLTSGGRVIFSGCGATGRLSIVLEAMWRRSLLDIQDAYPDVYRHLEPLQDRVLSIMTGGDFALARSVESFEDYDVFGRRQVQDLGVGIHDTVVGITEGGETSSVIGTVNEASERGAAAFMLFNNPADILIEHLERCRRVLTNPHIIALDLYCCPMAVAGSTRMQATTAEQLIAGAALENALATILRERCGASLPKELTQDATDRATTFDLMLDSLMSPASLRVMADHIEFEERMYQTKGLLTYYADRAILDIFTDTTERTPTFMIPPFRKSDDTQSPLSWAFVKHPLFPNEKAWDVALVRKPRCLDWNEADYRQMNAAESICSKPPAIGAGELKKFQIGCEADAARLSPNGNAAVLVLFGSEISRPSFYKTQNAFTEASKAYRTQRTLVVGSRDNTAIKNHVSLDLGLSLLNLFERLAMKLVLNTISTGTMVRMDRVAGNWMSYVSVSNKKLIDRSIRLVSELCGIGYEAAAYDVFEAMDDLEHNTPPTAERISPVQHVLRKHKR